MRISASKEEFIALTAMLCGIAKMDPTVIVGLIQSSISFDNGVKVFKSLPVGSVSMRLDVSVADGCLVLNIKDASFSGLNPFGLVRKMAGDILLKTLNPYQKYVKSWKYQDGNIRLQVAGVTFTAVAAQADIFMIELTEN